MSLSLLLQFPDEHIDNVNIFLIQDICTNFSHPHNWQIGATLNLPPHFSPLCFRQFQAPQGLFPCMVFAVPRVTGITSTHSILHLQARMTNLLREIPIIVTNTATSFTYCTCLWHEVRSCNCLQVCNIPSQCKLLPLDSLLFINNLAGLSNSPSQIFIHWEWLYLVAIASCIWLPSRHVLPEQFTGQMR